MNDIVTKLEKEFLLCCPACKGRLDHDDRRCGACGRPYELLGAIPSFLDEDTKRAMQTDVSSDKENAFLNYCKRWPKFYTWMTLIVAPICYTGLTAKKFLRQRGDGQRLLNVGSGASRLHPHICNVDLIPFENVHVVADAKHLPFPDETFDAVCSDQVLEHVFDPSSVVAEMLRVTKPGGLIYVAAPFMYPLHPSPKDYSRWSVDGLVMMFSGHTVAEAGVLIGPVSGTMSVLASGLATFCSFGITPLRKALHYGFMLILTPFSILDFFYARVPGAKDVAGNVYVVIQK